MDTSNGQLVPWETVATMPPEKRGNYVEVQRDLTKLEEATKQIKMYSPCGCGSGKKFKFCCHLK
jgi:uncharacterized protein YchJ